MSMTNQPTETPTPRTDEVEDQFNRQACSRAYVFMRMRLIEKEMKTAQAEIARLKEAGEKMKSAIKAKWGGSYLSSCQCRDCEALAAWEKLK